MGSNADKIATLEKEIEKLKSAQSPPPLDYEAERKRTAEYADQVHQARERRANSFRFSPAVQREMNAACGTNDLKDLVQASHRPQGPSSQGVIPSSQTLTGVRGPGRGFPAGDGAGWREATPLSNPPGVAQADRLMDAQDARDRAARIAEDNRLREALKR
jgi:hypothetical protein